MKNKIIIILIALIGLCFVGLSVVHSMYKKEKGERQRLEQNQRVLLSDISTYKAKNGELITRTEALQQTERELKKYNSQLLSELKNLRVRPKDLRSVTNIALKTEKAIETPLRDTANALPVIKTFDYADKYTRIKGTIANDKLNLDYKSTDSLTIFQHIEKHKFLFIRWGQKAEWWDIKNENPANTITGFKVVKVMH